MPKLTLKSFKGLEDSALFAVTGGAPSDTTVQGSSTPSINGRPDRLDLDTRGTSDWDHPDHTFVNGVEVDYRVY